MNTSKKILTVTDLKKSYITKGNTYPVLQGINMEVNQGEFIAVMGPSGSGKTTLLNIISGFLSADSGSVMIGAENMLHTDKNKQAEIRSSILGFIFQDFMLINGLTVRENICPIHSVCICCMVFFNTVSLLYRPYFYDWMAGNFYCHTDLDFRIGDFAVEKYNLLIKGRCD